MFTETRSCSEAASHGNSDVMHGCLLILATCVSFITIVVTLLSMHRRVEAPPPSVPAVPPAPPAPPISLPFCQTPAALSRKPCAPGWSDPPLDLLFLLLEDEHAWSLAALLAQLNCAWNRGVNVWRSEVPRYCWKEVASKRVFHYGPGDAEILVLARECRSLTHLNLAPCHNVSNDALFAVANGCPQLTQLHTTSSSISDAVVAALTSCCPLLTSLDLCQSRELSNAAMYTIADHCPRLQLLRIKPSVPADNRPAINDLGAMAVVSACSMLRDLNLGSFVCTDATAKAIASSSVRLVSLTLNLGGLKLRRSQRISESGLAAIAAGCLWLEELRLHQASWLRDGEAAMLAPSFSRLKRLSMDECHLSDVGVEEFVRCCPDLIHLALMNNDFITDRSIQMIRSGCPRLESLFLSFNDRLTDACYTLLATMQFRCKTQIVSAWPHAYSESDDEYF
mmetsp:Transcript_14262/g.27833  ORF Transcript_14262/g.27833 Transcript_14262/m.27833 type:complete len:452 (+) Transcript_14262:93-1448(+)